MSHLTCADFLASKGKKTSLVARLSTVTHEKGSPESLRDVRGFSVKFYTDEVSPTLGRVRVRVGYPPGSSTVSGSARDH